MTSRTGMPTSSSLNSRGVYERNGRARRAKELVANKNNMRYRLQSYNQGSLKWKLGTFYHSLFH
ncbi:hypothetical protein RchiOBHm_Chr5g0001951 [Rosa chinensis]|uniref:Uncharacterized protein n=1 Tax=Rosa chinensis TaxID=74649 RepID=A0A2P6Q2B6_ROSCH|nr:hypothetical protein RchiOBHm_Chr5g0001951 [Rosa chinensis]